MKNARSLRYKWPARGVSSVRHSTFVTRHFSLLSLIALALAALSAVTAREVQSHGVLFEKWLRDTFFGGYTPKSYTQKWDIPAEFNPDHGHIPVNPKAIKYGTPVDFGDAMRQFEIVEKKERFLAIIGFWDQVTKTEKKWVNVQAADIKPADWARLWSPITRADLEKLIAIVKNKSLSLDEARKRAKEMKSQPPFTEAIMQVNPKIDGSQRRLQCSIRFDDFFKHLAPDADPARQDEPKVFGVPVPKQFESGARTIAPKKPSLPRGRSHCRAAQKTTKLKREFRLLMPPKLAFAPGTRGV